MSEPEEAVQEYFQEVFTHFPFTDHAVAWLLEHVRFEVEDLSSTRGGGYWYPEERKVFLFTAQYEAAIHELAHAWWHYRRLDIADELIDQVVRLSSEASPEFARMRDLAHGYIHGIPAQNWPGMLVDRNDWEMYAGLASGCMADIRLLPPYVRRYYHGLFRMLEAGEPEPVSPAPHR